MLVSVDWSGGPAAMGMIRMGRGLTDQISKKGEMKTGTSVFASGDTLVGEWDESRWAPDACCDLHALRGTEHVELDWTGTRLSTEGAGKLLDAAIKRLDSPLKIDGAAGVPAALQLYSQEAKDSTLNMCALLPQADVETALGKKLRRRLSPGPVPSGVRECDYHVVTEPGYPPEEYDLTLRRGATVRSRSPRTRRGRDGVACHASPIHWRHRRNANRHARPPAWPVGRGGVHEQSGLRGVEGAVARARVGSRAS